MAMTMTETGTFLDIYVPKSLIQRRGSGKSGCGRIPSVDANILRPIKSRKEGACRMGVGKTAANLCQRLFREGNLLIYSHFATDVRVHVGKLSRR
jgi:hypothetical protein